MSVQPDLIDQVAMLLTEDPTIILEWRAKPYINPDVFYTEPGAVPFIYTTDGQIFYGLSEYDSHWEILENNRILIKRYRLEKLFGFDYEHGHGYPDFEDISSSPRNIMMESGDLLGRIGYQDDDMIVSFWNIDKNDYERSLESCLKRLITDNKINSSAFISTPVHKTIPISAIANIEVDEIDPEMRKQVELYRKLHLLRGDEKKNAMRQLGVGWTQQTQHPMQTAMRQSGSIGPGQKWWATTSEDVVSQIAALLTDTLNY